MSKKLKVIRVNHVIASELLEAARDSLLGTGHDGPCDKLGGHSRCHHCIGAEVLRRWRLQKAVSAVDLEIARLRAVNNQRQGA